MTTLPDNNRHALRQVARACRKAALSTVLLDGQGAPYTSLVTVAFDHALNPLLLLSGIADHTKNLMQDPRVALLLDGTDGHPNPQTGPRVTVVGRAEMCDDADLRHRFLARHPGAALYAGFGDFSLWQVRAERAHFVGGFGRAVWFEPPFGVVFSDLQSSERAIVQDLNESAQSRLDHLGGSSGWRLVAVDCDGFEIMQGQDQFRRLDFAHPVDSANAATQAILYDEF